MNTANQNKIIIWSAIGIVVIIGAVLIYRFQTSKVSTDNVQTAMTPVSSESKLTLGQFIKRGGSFECTARQITQGIATSGKIYFSNGMIRGNFSANAGNSTVTGSTIVRDSAAYTWSTASTDGVKVPLASNGSLSGFVEVDGSTFSWSADQITDYDCTPWTPDLSQFTLPSNVTFRDLEFKG